MIIFVSYRRKTELQQGPDGDGIKDAPLVMSTSQENMTREDRDRESRYSHYIVQNYAETPIKDEGIFGFEPDGSFRYPKYFSNLIVVIFEI